MSRWDETKKRKTLEDFPCVNDFSALKGKCCFGSDCYMDDCMALPIFRKYIRLRDVVEAEIGHYTPSYRAEHWRIKAKMAATPEAERQCNDNAKAWEALK